MKKLLIFFLFAGLVFSTSSCRKKETCPEPEVWGVGTWKTTKVVLNGTEQDASDPTVACWLTDEMDLNDNGGGTLQIHDYDPNTSTCQDLGFTLNSWLENIDKKVLALNITTSSGDFTVKMDYVDNKHIHWNFDSTSYQEFTKQD